MNCSRPALLALAFAAAACARAGDPERAAQSAAVEEVAIRAMGARFDTLIANRDTSALVAMYAPDAIVMPMEFPTATDTAAIRRIWVAALSFPQLEMRFTPMKLEIAIRTLRIQPRGAHRPRRSRCPR